MTFHVGQKVARCGGRNNSGLVAPAVGEVSTVSNIYTDSDGELHLELIEYPSPSTQRYMAGFRARFFRPVIERKTDISIFTEMLTPNRHKLVPAVIDQKSHVNSPS